MFKNGHKINKGRKVSLETRKKIGESNRKESVLIECGCCKTMFTVWPSKKETAVYCSRKCSFEGLKGKPTWNKGLKGYKSGEEHYNWKGGITDENLKIRNSSDYKEWRKSVFERDDYTCQECKVKGGVLNADHIKSFALYPELRMDLDNGRTLCYDCHRKTDTWGVKINSLNKEKILC